MAGEKRERESAPKPVTATGPNASELGRADGHDQDRSAPSAFGELAQRAARSSCTILVTGETGVGKGYLAKWVHAESPRHNAPFIPVNCGAIPESIIDSQLFGHTRGSFSGATNDHIGFVRAATGGTLFLDEVGELPPTAQTRLLRLLQDQEVQPVGHPRPIVVDVRILAATNSDLRACVDQKTFREDLLFRLDVVRIQVPPLRERREELARLVTKFDAEFADLYRQSRLEFTDEVRERLLTYPWPGNIRELRTLVERLHVLCPDQLVTVERLAEVGHPLRPAADRPRSLDNVRHEEVIRVLDDNGGSVARAAAVFGVHRSTIYRWLQSHQKQPSSPRRP